MILKVFFTLKYLDLSYESIVYELFPIKKYRWHDRRYRVESSRQHFRKHVCMTAFLTTLVVLHFCLSVLLSPASLQLCAA